MLEMLQTLATEYKQAIELACLLLTYALLMGIIIEKGGKK